MVEHFFYRYWVSANSLCGNGLCLLSRCYQPNKVVHLAGYSSKRGNQSRTTSYSRNNKTKPRVSGNVSWMICPPHKKKRCNNKNKPRRRSHHHPQMRRNISWAKGNFSKRRGPPISTECPSSSHISLRITRHDCFSSTSMAVICQLDPSFVFLLWSRLTHVWQLGVCIKCDKWKSTARPKNEEFHPDCLDFKYDSVLSKFNNKYNYIFFSNEYILLVAKN